jgi:hypothetical protein
VPQNPDVDPTVAGLSIVRRSPPRRVFDATSSRPTTARLRRSIPSLTSFIWTLVFRSMFAVIHSVSTGASGRIQKSWTHRISVRSGSASVNVQVMFMNSNGPVSTRRARTRPFDRSHSRRDTHDHTLPLSSGCMVRRNVAALSDSSRTSTEAYSENSSGHPRRSLAIRQARSSGASTTTVLSVWPITPHPPRPAG